MLKMAMKCSSVTIYVVSAQGGLAVTPSRGTTRPGKLKNGGKLNNMAWDDDDDLTLMELQFFL